jgi:hypothetical protein
MKKNTTNPTNVQHAETTNAAIDFRDSMDAASRFINRFDIIALLGECGAYKEKGVPVRVILLYIFNLMFSPMSMYYQIKMGSFHEDFSKNTVYRFLGNIHMNWHMFMLRLSTIIIRHLWPLKESGQKNPPLAGMPLRDEQIRFVSTCCRYEPLLFKS